MPKTKLKRAVQKQAQGGYSNTPLGKFEQIPYEVRELIWLDLAPTGQDTRLRRIQKTGLGILCACRALYKEISRAMWQKSSLEFDLTPSHRQYQPWATVYFTNKDQSRMIRDNNIDDHRTRWILKSFEDACNRGFDNIPFQKIRDITVNLFATKPYWPWTLYTLWIKVTELVRLFKRAKVIQNLTIHLKKHDGCDWIDRRGIPNGSFNKRFDHDVVILPFCTIPNIRTLSVETHSARLSHKIDWSFIDRAIGYAAGSPAERDALECIVGFDYYWIHRELWERPVGRVANYLRLEFLRNWYSQGTSGFSQFDNDMCRILRRYPEIPKMLDPELLILEEMHKTMVCLYHYAMKSRLKNVLGEPWDWQREAWDNYLEGIPPGQSMTFYNYINCYYDNDVYWGYALDKSSALSILQAAMDEWLRRPE